MTHFKLDDRQSAEAALDRAISSLEKELQVVDPNALALPANIAKVQQEAMKLLGRDVK